MKKWLFIPLVVLALFSCKKEIQEDSKVNNYGFEREGRFSLFTIFLIDFVEAETHCYYNLQDRSEKSDSISPNPYSRIYMKSLARFYYEFGLLSRSLRASEVPLVKNNLIKASTIIDTLLSEKIPFTSYFKLVNLKAEINEVLHSSLKFHTDEKALLRLLMSVHDFAWDKKSDCGRTWYQNKLNTGMILKFPMKVDSLRILHAGLMKQSENIMVYRYNLNGELLDSSFHEKVDSIKIEIDEQISVVEVKYVDRFDFRDYYSIQNVGHKILQKIGQNKKMLKLEKWFERMMDRMHYRSMFEYDLYGIYPRMKRKLYDNRKYYDYQEGKEYTIEDLKFQYNFLKWNTGRINNDTMKMPDYFDTITNPLNKEDQQFMQMLLYNFREKKELHRFEYLYYTKTILSHRGWSDYYCWGCAKAPENEGFGLWKKENDYVIIYTGNLDLYNNIPGTFPMLEKDCESVMDTLKFPMEGMYWMTKHRKYKMDSISGNQIISYSTN